MTVLRLLGLVVVLNLVRYLVGGPIEAMTIMGPMHAVMPRYPEVFDLDFTSRDFAISLGYNFAMWFVATWVFHLLHPVLRGPMLLRSFKSYGLMCLFFWSLAAVYMNHYADPVKPFYLWSMVDAAIVFSVVAVANGLLYPVFFRRRRAVRSRDARADPLDDGGVAHIGLRDALNRIPGPDGERFVELLERGGLEVELYAPRDRDLQTPHSRDELYVVARGAGTFFDGRERLQFEPGALLFVAAGRPHRFEDLSDDLAVWVVFFGPDAGDTQMVER